MPLRPSRLCKHPGCGRVAEANGYCKLHQSYAKQISYVKDKDIHNMYSHKWQKVSKAFLAKHPWCAECLRQDETWTPATVVDHIKPHRGNQSLFWDRNNWQPLCKHHHDQKTARGE